MAISARQAQLQNQRSPYGKMRVLSPSNNSISSISRQNTQSELKTMIERYNDGIISNSEMNAFLGRIVNSPGLTVSERVDVEGQIRNFDSLVRKDQLETAFKQAPELSLEKVQAAQAIADFYRNRAATMSPDTPAYNQALQNAATWDSQVASINESANKLQRQNQRYLAEQKVNMIPTGTSQNAIAKSQMYQNLAQEAYNDGDITEYNKYLSYANQFQTQSQELALKEQDKTTKEERNNIINYLNTAINNYHDGKINGQQMAQVLTDIDNWAVQNNDSSLLLKVNTESDKLAKIEAKGGYNRSTYNNLPVVLGKGTTGGSSTNWDVEDKDYSDNIRVAQEMLKSGKWDVNKYNEVMGKILSERQGQIDERVNTLEAIAETNPNDKYYYGGKKQRVADLLERIYAEQGELDPQVQAFQNGTATVVEVPPDKKMGKNTVTYQLIDVNSIPPEEKDQYAADESGVLHKILRDQVAITPDLQKNVFNGYYTDPETGESQPVRYDTSGNAYIYGSQKVRVYDTDTGNYVDQPYVKDQPVQSYIKYDQTQKEAQMVQQQQKEKAVQEAVKPLIPDKNINVKSISPQANPVQINANQPGLTTDLQSLPKQEATAPEVKSAPPIQKVMEPVTNTATQVYKAAEPILFNPIKNSIQNISPPTVSAPSTPPSGGTYKPTIQVNNQTMVKQYDPNKGITYQPLQVPKPPEPKQNIFQRIGTWLTGR